MRNFLLAASPEQFGRIKFSPAFDMKNNLFKFLVPSMALLFVAASHLSASTEVRVLESWPESERVALAPNQNFFLRLAYRTEEPVGIWVRPYFQGKPVNAGTNPSPTYRGTGEAIGWFFFMTPGDQVDEIRITAGDGRTENTPVVTTWHGHVIGGDATDRPREPPPAWVTDLLAKNQQLQEEAYRERMNEPTSTGEVALFNGFMLAILAIGVIGFAGPTWGLWRWRGPWRVAAAIPAAIMAFVVLRIVWDGFLDPTSHNLWPFEILMAGAASAIFMAFLHGLRKLFRSKN